MDEENFKRFPQNGRYNLSSWLLCFGRFEQGSLLSTQLTVDLILECSNWFKFRPPNSCQNKEHIVVFDPLSANVLPITQTAFPLTNVHAKLSPHVYLVYLRYLINTSFGGLEPRPTSSLCVWLRLNLANHFFILCLVEQSPNDIFLKKKWKTSKQNCFEFIVFNVTWTTVSCELMIVLSWICDIYRLKVESQHFLSIQN